MGTGRNPGCSLHFGVLAWVALLPDAADEPGRDAAPPPDEGDNVTANWYRRPQVLIAAGVFVLTLCVYTATLNSTTPFWDSGEFITTSHIVGVPH